MYKSHSLTQIIYHSITHIIIPLYVVSFHLKLAKAQKYLNRRSIKEALQEAKKIAEEGDNPPEKDVGPNSNVSLMDQHSELKKMAESKYL